MSRAIARVAAKPRKDQLEVIQAGPASAQSPAKCLGRRPSACFDDLIQSSGACAIGGFSLTQLDSPQSTAAPELSSDSSDAESDFSFEDDDDWFHEKDRETKSEKTGLPIGLQSLIPVGGQCAYRELDAAEHLTEVQREAVMLVTQEAERKSKAAEKQLRRRLKKLGYPGKLQEVLDYIKNDAPILIHVDLESRISRMKEDTHYRNQFETGCSRGSRNLSCRKEWEDRLFQGKYKDSSAEDRVKYGVLNAVNDPHGIASVAGQYGRDYFMLKSVRLRATFSDQDSCYRESEVASCEWYAHVLNKYNDKELAAVVRVAQGDKLFEDSSVLDTARGGYKEVQIHGEILFSKHVEAVVVHPSRRGTALGRDIQEWCDKLGVRFQFMPETRTARALPGPPGKGGEEAALPVIRLGKQQTSLWRWRPCLLGGPWQRFNIFDSAMLEEKFRQLMCPAEDWEEDEEEEQMVPRLHFPAEGAVSSLHLVGDVMSAIVEIDRQEVELELERYLSTLHEQPHESLVG
eukprot:gb/GFBE01075487.1/.p1 GENE.gb/GFBE01075487.1/~~gb/GFBE01075487.1/.p1  ORF type:complete len:517 (+),score=84.92 gb/GFBE01075487.1/:1-1551(+)